jgi:uncharacterized protein
MSIVYISSTGDHAGQSLISWTIARRLVERVLNPGFFKPFGTGRIQVDNAWADPDAFLFRKVLNIKEPLDMICPFADPESAEKQQSPKNILTTIKNSVELFLTGRDILLILGSKHIFFDETLNTLPDISIMSEVNANLILVHRYQKLSTTLYSILSVHSLLREKVRGIIINRVPPDKIEEVKRQTLPVLHEKGIINISFIPEDPRLSFRRVGEICKTLDGKVAYGEDLLGNAVERMSVGATNLQNDLGIFKRVYNKIVLVDPSNEYGAAGIIMTGNREPGEKLMEAVKKTHTPLILIKEDSLEALERLESVMPSLSPEDENKAIHCSDIMNKSGSLDRLIDSLEIGK